MKALIATNRPDRFESLSRLLASRGHDVRMFSTRDRGDADDAAAKAGRSSDPHEEESPPESLRSSGSASLPSAFPGVEIEDEVGTGVELAFADLEEERAPRAALAELRSRAGRLALTVALLDRPDADRAHRAIDAGFDDVLFARVDDVGIRTHAWEVRLATGRARSNGLPAEEPAARATMSARGTEDELASFRAALEGTNIFVFSVDRDMRFSWIGVPRNGFTAAELLGRRIDEPARVQDVRELEEALRDALERGVETSREVRSTISGEARRQLVHAVPRRERDGRIVAVDVTSVDITELREAKESAERSRAQLEAVFQAVQDGIVVVDMEGNIRFANQALARSAGFSSAEEMRLQLSFFGEVFELFDLEGRPIPREEWPIAKVLRGERISEWLLVARRKDTGREWRRVYAGEPVRDEHGTQVFAVLVVRDVTAQMHAEEELRRTTTLLQAIRESSSDLVYAKDRAGRMIMTNPANLAMIGKDERDVIGRTDLEFLSDEESARIVMENDRRIMESGQAETLEESVRYPDGTVRIWLSTKTPYRDTTGNVIGLLGISREITERKRTEDEVRRERALFSRLIDRLPVLLVIFDAKDGTFRLNEEFRRTLGWSEEAAARDDLFVLAFPDPEVREQVRNLMATSAPGWHDFTAVSKDGTEVPGSWAYLMADGIRVGIGIDLRERKRAEQELRDTQKLMQGLMDNFPAVIVFKDVAGRFVDCNREFERAIRLPRESILGRTDHELFPRELADRFREADLEAMRSRIPMQSEEVLSIGGVDADFLVIRFPLIDSQGRVYGVGYITHDITERKKADAALRESEERLRQIVHANPVGMILSDLSGGVFEANEAFLATIGYTRDDLEHGRVRWDAITPPEWLVVDDRHVREALETGTTRPYEKEFVHPDGRRIPVVVGFSTLGERRGLETRAAAFILDLSREKEVLEALRQSEESFRAIAESLPGLVWATSADGRFEYLNRRWCEYTGHSFEEGLRMTGVDTLDPAMAAEVDVKWRNALATGAPYEVEARLRRFDGAYRWFLMKALPVHDSHGRIIRWIGTGLDIEDQKRAEQNLLRSKEELEALVRERTAELERKAAELGRSNAELQRFAYIASHDLQEPLRIVVSYAQLLGRRYQGRLDESADEYIGFMTQAARHMRHLINDLQTYARAELESPRAAPVAVSACVREAIARHGEEIRRLGAEIAVGPLPLVDGDQELLQSLLDQLVANALKFHASEPPRIVISAALAGDEWIFSVRDNGIGIAEEFRETIFQPFRRLHRWDEYPGTGIGLAICRRIAESHGGRIWVESAEGGGSVFRFALPGARVRAEGISSGQEVPRGEPG